VIGVAKTVRSANLSRLDPSLFLPPTGLNAIECDSYSSWIAIPKLLDASRNALAALDKDILAEPDHVSV